MKLFSIFHQIVIKTYFGMLKSSEHEKLWHYSYYESQIFKDCSEVRSADPPILFYYKILRIGGPRVMPLKVLLQYTNT